VSPQSPQPDRAPHLHHHHHHCSAAAAAAAAAVTTACRPISRAAVRVSRLWSRRFVVESKADI